MTDRCQGWVGNGSGIFTVSINQVVTAHVTTWSILTVKIPGPFPTQPWQWPVTTRVYKQEAANTVYSSWWWAVCHSKHVEPSINFGIINSITKLHLVGISTESSTMHGSTNIKVDDRTNAFEVPYCVIASELKMQCILYTEHCTFKRSSTHVTAIQQIILGKVRVLSCVQDADTISSETIT